MPSAIKALRRCASVGITPGEPLGSDAVRQAEILILLVTIRTLVRNDLDQSKHLSLDLRPATRDGERLKHEIDRSAATIRNNVAEVDGMVGNAVPDIGAGKAAGEIGGDSCAAGTVVRKGGVAAFG